MHTVDMRDLSEMWVDGRPELRWRSKAATSSEEGAVASASALLEVEPGCSLPRHTDSAEETVVVVSGTAEVEVGGERATVFAGGVALVPEGAPHQVRNAGFDLLRFVALYAAPEIVTRYEAEVQPAASTEQPIPG